MDIQTQLSTYLPQLVLEEKSAAMREKYTRNLQRFAAFTEGRTLNKALVLEYKAMSWYKPCDGARLWSSVRVKRAQCFCLPNYKDY